MDRHAETQDVQVGRHVTEKWLRRLSLAGERLGALSVSDQNATAATNIIRADDTGVHDLDGIEEETLRVAQLTYTCPSRPKKNTVEQHPAEPRRVADLELESVGYAPEVKRWRREPIGADGIEEPPNVVQQHGPRASAR
jgi:hypothetical protein